MQEVSGMGPGSGARWRSRFADAVLSANQFRFEPPKAFS
jgi:hypothetical protein